RQPSKVYHITVIDRLERWHFQVLFPAKLPEHRKFCMRGGNFSIGRIQIAIAVEVYISENVVTVSVGVYHHERQAGDFPDDRMYILDTVHRVYDSCFFLAADEISG